MNIYDHPKKTFNEHLHECFYEYSNEHLDEQIDR